MFHWPDSINAVFDLSMNRLQLRRERAEEELKKKVLLFEEKLVEYGKEIETFKKKEVLHSLISYIAVISMYDKYFVLAIMLSGMC